MLSNVNCKYLGISLDCAFHVSSVKNREVPSTMTRFTNTDTHIQLNKALKILNCAIFEINDFHPSYDVLDASPSFCFFFMMCYNSQVCTP